MIEKFLVYFSDPQYRYLLLRPLCFYLPRFSTKPVEIIEHFTKYNVNVELVTKIQQLHVDAEKVASVIKLKDDDLISVIEAQFPDLELNPTARLLNIPGLNRTKLLKNALKDILVRLQLPKFYARFSFLIFFFL